MFLPALQPHEFFLPLPRWRPWPNWVTDERTSCWRNGRDDDGSFEGPRHWRFKILLIWFRLHSDEHITCVGSLKRRTQKSFLTSANDAFYRSSRIAKVNWAKGAKWLVDANVFDVLQ